MTLETEYERMRKAALEQIDVITGGNREYLEWHRKQGTAADRAAIDNLRLPTLAVAPSIHPAAFASLLHIYVAMHHHLFTLWTIRDEMKGPLTFPMMPSVN